MNDQSNIVSGDEYRTRILKRAGNAGKTYPPLDHLVLTNESFMTLSMLAADYQRTKNTFYAIRVFTECVAANYSPPAWVLDALCEGFQRHLSNPNPELLA